MEWGWAILVAAGVFAASFLLTRSLRHWLAARAILDLPVARSSHRVPVPRGGGLAVLPALFAGWLLISWRGATAGIPLILLAAAALAVLSWRDDRGGLPVPVRLGAHALAVVVGLATLPHAPVFRGILPTDLDRLVTAILWLWFIELYNFMDGIDGIAGVETASLGVGLALVLGLAGGHDGTAALALVAAAAALGFLWWNWHPAQIFLGDVGSVPLGFLLGWLLLVAAARGLWAPALILPLYYLADATITLARRIMRRAPFWEAHREHFYQRAVPRDGNHSGVVRVVLGGNVALIALVFLALLHPMTAVALAVLTVAVVLFLLERRARCA